MEVSPELFPSELEPALAEVLSRWPLGEENNHTRRWYRRVMEKQGDGTSPGP